MSPDAVDHLLAEAIHMRSTGDEELDALCMAVLVEDVLGLRLADEQIRPDLADGQVLRSLLQARTSTG